MEEHTTGNKKSALLSTGSVLDWATQFYCDANDYWMVLFLLRLRKSEASEDPNDWCEGDSEPLYLVFCRLSKCAEVLGPMYLGLKESEEVLDKQQPWASPLNLHHMAKSADTRISKAEQYYEDGGPTGSSPARATLEPFSSPFNSPQRSMQQSKPKSLAEISADMKCLDVAEMIHRLIRVENTRRRLATEYLDWKHTQGSVGEQSERWQHHFAKRNISAEIKFENILVALKELVVLNAIITPSGKLTGDLPLVLNHLALKQRSQPCNESTQAIPNTRQQGAFDAAQCLAVLNIMFPLESLPIDTRCSCETKACMLRYAMPLRHVPSPRMQLYQLLCETEAWVNGDDRVRTSVGTETSRSSIVPFDQISQSADDQGDVLGDGFGEEENEAGQNNTNRISDHSERTPANCPTWLAAARGFAWGQVKQSCHAYLRYAQHRITNQQHEMHPWKPPASTASEHPTSESAQAHESSDVDSTGGSNVEYNDIKSAHTRPESQRITDAILSENEQLLREVEQQAKPGATVIERIVRHSRLVKARFSPYATYKALAK
ncbi:hypothetical protein COEREDRAFT_87388 [Coemansia reversa NRRL 1564]|uniref:Uncharacterized protein n=1 Tax=Coemansia reversa (strain ATCC 12441 / NRRL 1564) TaxID=763665 RepID=A0A2G5BA73_COERN|nr:hypothetical protein COEREDRAFT_87388 [Coemansia reversa NRRL 1564]|eukprot:PIA15890.1 hypothetical protein COEREDRAFT_87388 [Coemansia reversa NRRL 1564]